MTIFVAPGLSIATGFVVTLAMCVLLVLTKSWHGALTLDGAEGVQKFHTAPTPRVGGIAIYLGLLAALYFAPDSVSELLGPMMTAGLPAFAFGLAEDLTKRVSVRARLLATMASGALAWWLTGVSLTRVELWGVDSLLAFLPCSVIFTAFAVAGVANSVNIIDGFNGLASGTLIICFSALGLIAFNAGDPALAQLCLVLGAVTAGFLAVNFPFGKLFLGDGGAYLLGFMLAWVAVMLPMRNPQVSVWAPLLACGYPVLEVLFSMARRYARSYNPGQPDRLHLHSLIKCRISRKKFRRFPAPLRNASVSPFCWLYALVPVSAAVYFSRDTMGLMVSFVISALIYSACYQRLVRFRWGGLSRRAIAAARFVNQSFRPSRRS